MHDGVVVVLNLVVNVSVEVLSITQVCVKYMQT